MKNKLLFKLKINFGSEINLIADNHKDLEDYLNSNYDWYKIKVNEDSVAITERQGYESELGTLEWVKCI